MEKEVMNRRHLPAEKKYEIVKEVIMGKVPASEACNKYGIHTAQYYKWQQIFFNGALEGLKHRKVNGKEGRKDERLSAENQRLKDVIAEIAAENPALKKSLGE